MRTGTARRGPVRSSRSSHLRIRAVMPGDDLTELRSLLDDYGREISRGSLEQVGTFLLRTTEIYRLLGNGQIVPF